MVNLLVQFMIKMHAMLCAWDNDVSCLNQPKHASL